MKTPAAPATRTTTSAISPYFAAGFIRCDHRDRTWEFPGSDLMRRLQPRRGRPRRASSRGRQCGGTASGPYDGDHYDQGPARSYPPPGRHQETPRGRPHRRHLHAPRRSRSSSATTPTAAELKSGHRGRARRDGSVLWLTDRKGREVGVPVRQDRLRRDRQRRRRPPHRLRRAERARSAGDARTCSTASCCSSPARAASARPPSPPPWRCSPPSRASARSSARSTPRATWPTSSRPARPRSSPARSSRDLWAMSMDTEESLKEYLTPPAEAAAASPASARWPGRSTSSPPPRPG